MRIRFPFCRSQPFFTDLSFFHLHLAFFKSEKTIHINPRKYAEARWEKEDSEWKPSSGNVTLAARHCMSKSRFLLLFGGWCSYSSLSWNNDNLSSQFLIIKCSPGFLSFAHPFFSFAFEIMKINLFLCKNKVSDIFSERMRLDLEYPDGVVLLNEDPRKLQLFLDHPNDSVIVFERHFYIFKS